MDATKKLYYEDAYQKKMITKGLKQEQDENGDWYVVLEETVFYPTGGGQLHDVGSLNGVKVFKVEEKDGEIRHYVEQKLDALSYIEGEINWDHRFDYMQQHLGQHILSAAFVKVAGIETVSVHLGKETCTIDLNVKELSNKTVQEAENAANQIILENHPVITTWVTKEEAGKFPLRKKLSVNENIRLVIIPDYDYNGCGGTHPSTTGEVSGIKVLGWEKEKGKIRLEFICGKRIFSQFAKKHEVIGKLSQLLSAKEGELADAVVNLQNTNKKLTKELNELNQEILKYEAENLYHQVLEIGEKRIVKKSFVGKTMKDLQKIMRTLIAKDSSLYVILASEDKERLQFVCACPKDSGLNLKDVSFRVLPLIHGKGGGSSTVIQGGGEKTMDAPQLVETIIDFCQFKG